MGGSSAGGLSERRKLPRRLGRYLSMPPTARRRRTLASEGKANKDGSYPTDTKGRAVAAKGRATQAVNAGRMGKAEERRIDARANRELKGQSR